MKKEKVINGIQQIGIGVSNIKEVFNWYRKNLGFDILVFEDEAPAKLMTQYTNDVVENRLAFLALNMTGGGGLEIWQFKDRVSQPPKTRVLLGDLGINVMKIRSRKITKTYFDLQELKLDLQSDLEKQNNFFVSDPWNNLIQIVQDTYCFHKTKYSCGGVLGAIIGVMDMNTSIRFYQKLLGYDLVADDRTGIFEDFSSLPGGENKLRRVLLKHSERQVGGFGELYGPSEIELIQVLDRRPEKIYKNRLWGDLGYIHLCFDINGMDALKAEAKSSGYQFTVDSADSFDMGDAAGRFGYIEDPDGTLIELVETHKVPILKKFGIYIDLQKRNPEKPLPRWLVRAMQVHRVNKDL